MIRSVMQSPVGAVTVFSDGEAIVGIRFGNLGGDEPDAVISEAIRQLGEYFDGKRKSFELPLKPCGTPFQESVWRALRDIPYGETRAYGDIAKSVGNEKACRAVGMANNKNPIAIVIPCHRVIGADGSLTGYAAGTDIKKFLLELENNNK